MINCIICNNELTGKQQRFCSKRCKAKLHINKEKNYAAQKLRRLKYKLLIIEQSGGKCSACGYDKNIGALCFHHEGDKDFWLTSSTLSSKSLEAIQEELKKCVLLCNNCHAEHHHPNMDLKVIETNAN